MVVVVIVVIQVAIAVAVPIAVALQTSDPEHLNPKFPRAAATAQPVAAR